MDDWKWTKRKNKSCALLAAGSTIKEAAEAAGVDERTIYRWKNDPVFFKELCDLTLTTGIALRSERLILAKRVIKKLEANTEKDLLDWLKYAAQETDGLKLGVADELAELLTAFIEGSEPLAGSGPGGSSGNVGQEDEEAG